MKLKTSCFSLSQPLIKENLRRFWPISVIGFLIYFLSGVFPILISYRNLSSISYMIEASLQNENPFFWMAHLTLPILTAVIIFRYLQNASSAAIMHAMPFQRSTLYNSHFLSGLILIALPILLNGCILLAISKPILPDDYDFVAYNDLGTVFSRMSILTWMWQSLLILLFLYVIAVFAGIITGNSIMHFCSAIAFNFLLPALYGVLLLYLYQYLFGFNTLSGEEFALQLSPYLAILDTQKPFALIQSIAYIIAILVMFILSGFLYEKRKLEKANDALVYSFLEPIICYLIAFFSMTILGMYFDFLGENSALYRYIGYFSGALLGFLIGRMIVKKTIRIFNRSSLKSFGIYALIAAAFFLCLEFDVVGYEKRVPLESTISEISMDYVLDDFTHYSNHFKDDDEIVTQYSDSENIASILKFHKQIVENKDQFIKNSKDRNSRSSSIDLTYTTKSGHTIIRSYQVPYWLIENNDNLKVLYESEEFRADLKLKDVKASDLEEAMIESQVTSTIESHFINQDLTDLITVINKDLKALSYEQLGSLTLPICSVDITYTDRSLPKKLSQSGKMVYGTSVEEYDILPYYTNTIAWLHEHGYEIFTNYIKKKPLYAVGILISEEQTAKKSYQQQDRMTQNYKYPFTDDDYKLGLQPPKAQKNLLVVTNSNKILQLFEAGSNIRIDRNNYYSIQVVYEGNNGDAIPTEFYINNTNLPAFVSDYFR